MIERAQRVDAETVTGAGQVLFYAPVGSAEKKQLTVRDRIVRVDDSSYTCTIWLPPVAEAKGLTFNISASSGSNNVTITDFGGASYSDSRDWADLTLTADEDQVTLLSDGMGWIIVENKAT